MALLIITIITMLLELLLLLIIIIINYNSFDYQGGNIANHRICKTTVDCFSIFTFKIA